MSSGSHLSPTVFELLRGKPSECRSMGACACDLFFLGIDEPDQLGNVRKLGLAASAAVTRDMNVIKEAGCPKDRIVIVDTEDTPAILKVAKTIWR